MSNKFIACDAKYEKAGIIVYGVPFDGTVSYRPGTRFAPQAIRTEAYGIETYSPYQDRDLADICVCDDGDLELPLGNTARVVETVRARAKKYFADGKIPVMLGGEHLASLGAIEAAAEKYADLCIVHFDAHTDLREDYLGEKLSHAAVMKRAHDILGDGRIFQFCIRSGEKEEFLFAKKHTFLQKFNFDGLAAAMREVGKRPVYLTVDLDCLDPSEFPGTGTPEAGGVSFGELLAAIIEVCAHRVVAADLVEACPPCDPSGISTALACKTLRELLLALAALSDQSKKHG